MRQATKTRVADDPRGIAAAKAAAKINAATETYWRGLYLGRAEEAQQRYEAARQFTRALGFDAVPGAELFERPAEEIVARVKAVQARGIKPASDAANAVLGLVEPPALKLSGLVSAYEATQRATLSGKSKDQLQRWRTTKERAVNLLVEVAGDLRLDTLGRSHALDFRDSWQERIDAGEVEIDTANKAIGHLNKMWRELRRRSGSLCPCCFCRGHSGHDVAALQCLVSRAEQGWRLHDRL